MVSPIERCNGLDDDCDGVVDNGNPGGNQACNTGQLGVCAAGTTAYTAASESRFVTQRAKGKAFTFAMVDEVFRSGKAGARARRWRARARRARLRAWAMAEKGSSFARRACASARARRWKS
mgnify:CR=1 FL=1